MKKISIILIFLCSFSSIVQSQHTISDTIYREGSLYALRKNIGTDTLLMLERMASYHFHQLINQYRVSKRKKTIYWDDKLWLAARNHNVFMVQNLKHLSHSESKSKPYSTGRDPDDRMEYVTYGSREFRFGGFENCAASGSMVPGSMDLTVYRGDPIDDLIDKAIYAAEDFFDIWKHSPGHNANMLEDNHLAHGTSIIFGKESEYATSVFTQKQKYYTPDDLNVDFLGEQTDSFSKLFKENGQKYEDYPKGMNRIEFKLFSSLTNQFKQRQIEPDKGLYNLLKYIKEHREDSYSIEKKYKKATKYTGIFKLMKYQINSLNHSELFNFEEFYSLAGIESIEHFIQKNLSYINHADGWAGKVNVSESGNQFELKIEVFTLTKKKNKYSFLSSKH